MHSQKQKKNCSSLDFDFLLFVANTQFDVKRIIYIKYFREPPAGGSEPNCESKIPKDRALTAQEIMSLKNH